MTGARRKARALALQILYELDLSGHRDSDILGRIEADHIITPEGLDFTRHLFEGTIRHIDSIDIHIKKFAAAWPIEQLSFIDRNILRLAIFEILYDNQTPIRVAINEAVELAKRFGGDNSTRFVNGVLSSVSTLATDRE